MRITRSLEALRDDVTFAIRQLKSAPVFAIIAAVTLALGIGANSAIFALVDATLLRPLPYAEPDRLVTVWERSDSSPHGRSSPLNLVDWNERNRTFDLMAGFVPGAGGMVLARPDGTAETVARQWVTAGFFDVLGVRPVAGRTFRASDASPQPSLVVMSEEVWRSYFNGDPGVIGRNIRLDGDTFTVVGVVPGGFQLLGPSAIWAMLPDSRDPRARGPRFLQVVGRVKAGVTIDAAQADMSTVAEGLAREFPEVNKDRGILLEPMRNALIGGELRLTSMLFLGVVGVVLLICCANVANLLLARATVRTRELAVRTALGAGRSRVIRQLVTESLVLAGVGGVLGVGVGAAILTVAPLVIPDGLLPGAVTLTFDMRVVAFCAGTALLVGLLFGLAPAWQATSFSSALVVAADSRTTTGRGGRLRGLLVVGEVAAAVLLLFGAGLLLRTLLAVEHVDRGYRADRVLTMMVDPLGSRYPTPESLEQFFGSLEQEIAAVPGVRHVAWASTLPMGSSQFGDTTFQIVGDPVVAESQRPSADYQIVSNAYFQAVDLPLVAGRPFSSSDRRDAVQVCIVNEAFVRRHLQGRSPIGVRLSMGQVRENGGKPVIREIVGVARQVKGRPDEREDLVQIYVPYAQDAVDDIYLIVRPDAGPADALAPGVRAAIGRVDKEQLVSVREVMTLEGISRAATSRHRFRAALVMTFAGLALLLAMVGVFGILAYSVQQRVREFGVRMALGATGRDVLGLVLNSAVRVIAAGTAIGLALAAVLSRLLTSVLFGVQPLDPVTFGSVAIVLVLTAAVSIAGPVWRAMRIDPAVALRSE